MFCHALVSEIIGNRYRISMSGLVSSPLPRLQTVAEGQPAPAIAVGDRVAVLFWGRGLSDGLVLGRIEE